MHPTLETQLAPPADNPFTPFYLAHKHEGSTYQPILREWLKEHPEMKLLVETGSGCSTCYVTMALEERRGEGHLYSIDPKPWCGYSVEHERVTNIRKRSDAAMCELFLATGPWDFFLHDGNHDLYCQAYDIEMGYAFLRPGGWMWCDDYTWGEHHAWKRFAAARGLPLVDFGAASGVQKPMSEGAIDFALVESLEKLTVARLKAEAARWLAQGHPDSAVFAGQ